MSNTLFEYHFKVALHDIDAAGVMFFAHTLRHAHNAYEACMTDIGFSLETMIEQQRHLPIVHCDADYSAAIKHGENVCIQIQLKNIGKHSFTLGYQFTDSSNRLLAKATTVHVMLDSNKQPTALPQALAAALDR